MKVDELRVLEADELGMRLRTARRELYELRFKHAVGQLENSTQISKVRHDIARIMTVIRERDFGIAPAAEPDFTSPLAAEVDAPSASSGDEPEVEEEAPKPKRGRGRKTVQQRSRFKVHDEKNECGVGDLVRITETRPLSKEKRWRVLEIVEKAK